MAVMALSPRVKSEPNAETMQRVLVVEDTLATQIMIALQLESAGYRVITANNGSHALEQIYRFGLPHLAIVDVSLPDQDGFAVARAIHNVGDVPVILLAAETDALGRQDHAFDEISDCLVKPFAFPELLNSVEQALVQGIPPCPDREIRLYPHIQVNFAQKSLWVDGQQVMMTPTETHLLHLLYLNRGTVVAADFLLHNAWRDSRRATVGSLWVYIRRLRSKLEHNPDTPKYLMTVRGQGYLLRAETGYAP